MIRYYDDLPDWTFDIDERSAGVYCVIAINSSGNAITKFGTNPEILIEECRHEAINLDRKRRGD